MQSHRNQMEECLYREERDSGLGLRRPTSSAGSSFSPAMASTFIWLLSRRRLEDWEQVVGRRESFWGGDLMLCQRQWSDYCRISFFVWCTQRYCPHHRQRYQRIRADVQSTVVCGGCGWRTADRQDPPSGGHGRRLLRQIWWHLPLRNPQQRPAILHRQRRFVILARLLPAHFLPVFA